MRTTTQTAKTTAKPQHPNLNNSVTPGVKGGESKRDKFERLAVARVRKILKALDVLKNIGRNRRDYEFNNEDVAKIIGALRKRVDELEQAMLNTKEDDKGFEL